jgi:hypothetical protein
MKFFEQNHSHIFSLAMDHLRVAPDDIKNNLLYTFSIPWKVLCFSDKEFRLHANEDDLQRIEKIETKTENLLTHREFTNVWQRGVLSLAKYGSSLSLSWPNTILSSLLLCVYFDEPPSGQLTIELDFAKISHPLPCLPVMSYSEMRVPPCTHGCVFIDCEFGCPETIQVIRYDHSLRTGYRVHTSIGKIDADVRCSAMTSQMPTYRKDLATGHFVAMITNYDENDEYYIVSKQRQGVQVAFKMKSDLLIHIVSRKLSDLELTHIASDSNISFEDLSRDYQMCLKTHPNCLDDESMLMWFSLPNEGTEL